jgi:hypothetical protein
MGLEREETRTAAQAPAEREAAWNPSRRPRRFYATPFNSANFPALRPSLRAAEQMPSVKQLLARAAQQMAAALTSALDLTDVPEVVIGGAHFGAVEESFLPIWRAAVEGQALRPHIAPVIIKTTNIRKEANAIGGRRRAPRMAAAQCGARHSPGP